MNVPIRALPQQKADRCSGFLAEGRYDLMVETYSFPLAVFLEDRQLVLPTRDAAIAFFRFIHAALLAEGLTGMTTQIVAVEIPRDGRYRFWADLIGFGPAGRSRHVASAIYYCNSTEGRVQMIELRQIGLAQLSPV